MEDSTIIFRQDILNLLDREGILAHSACGCGSLDAMNNRAIPDP